MTLDFKICQHGMKDAYVTGYDDYPESDDVFSLLYPFTFGHSVTINGMTHLPYNNDSIIVDQAITEHYYVEDSEIQIPDETILKFKMDGLYEVSHNLIPTKDWIIIRLLDEDTPDLLKTYPNGVYYYGNGYVRKLTQEAIDTLHEEELDDGTKIYTFTDEQVIPLQQIIEQNTADTTIQRMTLNTFSTADLKECFYNICKALLPKVCGQCITYDLTELIQNRDLIWMALNVIEYCIQLGLYYEAQRHMQWIEECGTICSRKYSINNGGKDCGCNRRS